MLKPPRWQGGAHRRLTEATSKTSSNDVDCYVLNDHMKTAVISQRGMGAALGFSPQGGGRFPKFINGKSISPYLGLELREKLRNPLKFQGPTTVSGPPSNKIIHGFDVTLLIDVCKAIVAAESDGKLTPNQTGIAKQAHLILSASAKSGIKGLVYALAGYDATRQQVIDAFKLYVREEAREYEKEFPDQLYLEWYRLYKLPKPEKNKPWKFKHLTVEHVYQPLARSNGKILQLLGRHARPILNHERDCISSYLKLASRHSERISVKRSGLPKFRVRRKRMRPIFDEFSEPRMAR